MEVRAIAKYVRVSPQKCRLVADQVRRLPVGQALELLQFSPKKAAVPIRKTLESAIAREPMRTTTVTPPENLHGVRHGPPPKICFAQDL